MSKPPDNAPKERPMSSKPKESAESLYKFFQQLAPSGAEEEEEEEINYASAGVVRRGLEASRMLMAIQQMLGPKTVAAAPAPAQPDPKLAEEAAAAKQQLAEARTEIDRLLLQTMELGKQNKSLKEKIAIFQKQMERLYSKREMAQNLERIENKKLTALEQLAEQERAAIAAAEAKAAAAPAKKSLNKELAEELDVESAARAPGDDEEEGGEEDEGADNPGAQSSAS